MPYCDSPALVCLWTGPDRFCARTKNNLGRKSEKTGYLSTVGCTADLVLLLVLGSGLESDWRSATCSSAIGKAPIAKHTVISY